MLTKFDEQAQKAIVVGESIAFDLGHNNVGSEHLLLSLLKISDSKLRELVKKYDVDDKNIYEDIKRLFGTNDNDNQPFYMEYSDALKSILEVAIEITHQQNKSTVTLNILTIALLQSEESVAHELLKKYRVNFKEVISKLGTKNNDKPQNLSGVKKLTFAEIINPKKKQVIMERDEEVLQILVGLCCLEKANIAITGPAGVGKSAIIDELSRVLKYESVPKSLKGYTIVKLNLTSMLAGTKYRGDFEERLDKYLKEIRNKKVITFIDEGHQITATGNSDNTLPLSEMIKPILSRGRFKFIIATTENEYKIIEADAALNRRFRKVPIYEPEKEKVFAMIREKINILKKFHGVDISKETIDEIIEETSKIRNRCFPDKALDVIDMTMAYSQVMNEDFSIDYAKKYISNIQLKNKERKKALVN